jgi:putative two-component system response regulator
MPGHPIPPQTGRTILVVDDDPAQIRLIRRLLQADGHRVVDAGNGRDALEMVTTTIPDLVVMDVLMPGANGFEVCFALKADPRTRLVPVVLITALDDVTDRIRGLDAGADDFITKPVNTAELRARVRSLLRLKRYTDELDTADAVIISLALTIEARDQCTRGHCERLAAYAAALGAAVGVSEEEVDALRKGGFLHDIGKVGIPDAVLLKPGPLTPAEYAIMQQHTIIGDRLCGELRSLRAVRPIVRHHHERLDGSGYPDGLAGDRIPLLAQILSVGDVFDALTTARPYKAARTTADAFEELRIEAARGWRRRDLVDLFASIPLAGLVDAPWDAAGVEA